MTRSGPSKAVGRDFAAGRLRKAATFQKMAESALALLDPQDDPDVVVALAVLAAIAFADAVTAAIGQVVNRQDHDAAPKLLRAVLANKLPDAQERRLRAILSQKDSVQYGAGLGRRADAERTVAELRLFGAWATGVVEELP